MKPSSWVGLALAAVLLIVGIVAYFLPSASPETSETLIRQSLRDAESAAKARRVADVMEVISDDFQAGLWNKARLRLTLVRSLRNGRGVEYDVHVNEPRILPSPKGNLGERLVITRFSAFYSGSGEDIWGSDLLTLVMRQETRRRYLFFTRPRWRIVSVVNAPPVPLLE